MKSKAKLKKIKESNQKPKANLPQGWFVMGRTELTVSDLKNLLDEELDVQLWTEAGVMEIVLGEKSSMDIEEIEIDFRDEYSLSFIEDKKIKSLFYLTFRAEDYDGAKKVMGQIADGIDGFICGDTEDFTPIIGE